MQKVGVPKPQDRGDTFGMLHQVLPLFDAKEMCGCIVIGACQAEFSTAAADVQDLVAGVLNKKPDCRIGYL